jgi:hypothetical protein
VVASVPGLPEEFTGPKETAILDLCRQEKAQGRKVLLLCQQTDTLDIQPEWQRMLEAAGLKAAVLRAPPNKREGWVERQVQAGVDVVISHPRKVETGIDLLDFPTIVWMAIDYSVYTVLQASRRSWRIGQTRPVKVYYFCYEQTIQEDALQLVAAKVAASLRVNGDTVGEDGLAELDELVSGDLLATLARIVTGETQIEARSLQQAFAEANAGIRQANTIIGEYEVLSDAETAGDDETPAGIVTMPEPALRHISPQTLVFGAGEVGRTPFPLEAGVTHSARPNGKANGVASPARGPQPGKEQDGDGKAKPSVGEAPEPPPVPRPRLLLNQLRPG